MIRKITSLFVGILLAFRANAQIGSYAELEVRLVDQSIFTLSIDQEYYPYGQYVFTIKGITPGCHTLQITRLGTTYYPVRPDTLPVKITYQACLMPETRTVIIIDPRGAQSQQYTHGVISTTTPIRDPKYSNLYPELVYNPNDTAEFQILKKNISGAGYERVKSDIIKEAVFQYGIKSEALAELLPLMAFDQDRLALATFAYGFCLDQNQYFKLKKAFIFSNTYQQMIEKVDYYYPGKRKFN